MPLIINPKAFYTFQNDLDVKQKSQLEIIETTNNCILITSMHGVPHLRENNIKAPDSGSLEFAYLLAKFSNSSFYGLNTPNIKDNNYYPDTPQKKILTEFINDNNIQFLLDIHTCHTVRPFDVEIGSMEQKSLLTKLHLEEDLKECISNKHFFCIANQLFKGEGSAGSETMIRFISTNLGIPCLQIEINSALINEDGSLYVLHQKTKLLHCFCDFLNRMKL